MSPNRWREIFVVGLALMFLSQPEGDISCLSWNLMMEFCMGILLPSLILGLSEIFFILSMVILFIG